MGPGVVPIAGISRAVNQAGKNHSEKDRPGRDRRRKMVTSSRADYRGFAAGSRKDRLQSLVSQSLECVDGSGAASGEECTG